MEAFKMLFLLGLVTCLSVVTAFACVVVAIVGTYWLPVVCAVAFCLFVVAVAALVAFFEEREIAARYLASVRRRRSPAKDTQVVQIKVEADTSAAVAAIEDLQRRIEQTNAMMTALERIAIHNVMGEPT